MSSHSLGVKIWVMLGVIWFALIAIYIITDFDRAVQEVLDKTQVEAPHQLGELEQCQSDLAETLKKKERCSNLLDRMLRAKVK